MQAELRAVWRELALGWKEETQRRGLRLRSEDRRWPEGVDRWRGHGVGGSGPLMMGMVLVMKDRVRRPRTDGRHGQLQESKGRRDETSLRARANAKIKKAR